MVISVKSIFLSAIMEYFPLGEMQIFCGSMVSMLFQLMNRTEKEGSVSFCGVWPRRQLMKMHLPRSWEVMEKALMLQEDAIMVRTVGKDVGVVIEMEGGDMKMIGGIITKGVLPIGMIGGGMIEGEMMIDNTAEIDDTVETGMVGGEATVPPEIEYIKKCDLRRIANAV
jgi:hypothetical protein